MRKVLRVLGVVGVIVLLASLSALRAAPAPRETTFTLQAPAEVVAKITVQCPECAWDIAGREAIVFRLMVDGRYHQHLPIVRSGGAVYTVMLGRLHPGSHAIRVEPDAELTSRDLQGEHATIESIVLEQITESSPGHTPLSLAPIIYGRPDSAGRFTDIPVFMWYETEPTSGGTRYRYSVIFTNEDGGTPTDRLMATWGRTTDIEYLYSVEVDAKGAILAEDFQGPKHEVRPFGGTREGRHPLLWVSTENNMVLDQGTTRLRYAPGPVAFALRDASRETVMDAHPWLYAVMARELAREGKIVANAPPGHDTIPDPRRFVYVEGCGVLNGAALAFAIHAGSQWLASDRGLPEYRIARDGCFRAAVPLPAGLSAGDIRGLRAQAYIRSSAADAGPKPTGTAAARLTRVNTVFMLDEHYTPGAPLMQWQGEITLAPDGPPVEVPRP